MEETEGERKKSTDMGSLEYTSFKFATSQRNPIEEEIGFEFESLFNLKKKCWVLQTILQMNELRCSLHVKSPNSQKHIPLCLQAKTYMYVKYAG